MPTTFPSTAPFRIDFGETGNAQDWMIVNDGVMGGLSRGEGFFTDSSLVFQGEVSLDNNGGFASLRSAYQDFDLSTYDKVVIRCKSKGVQFAFTMNIYRQFYLPSFKKRISASSEDWQIIELPLKEFYAYRLGRQLDYKLDQENLEQIIRLGFITDEKKYAPFKFEIDYLEFR
ncbi:MAG: CIA30 family protein [Bacteroidota bacterium]